MRGTQLQALALGGEPAVLRDGDGQVLFENGAVSHCLAAACLALELQLKNLDFAAHDGLARVQIGRIQFQQYVAGRHALSVSYVYRFQAGGHRHM